MDKSPETVIEIASYFGRIKLRKWPQYIGTGLASMTQFSIGIIMAFSAILVPQLRADASLLLSPEQQSLLVSITTAGIVLGCALSSVLLRLMGPRRLMMLQGPPAVASWLLVALASDLRLVICGRLLVSFLNATTLSCYTMYICEIASPQARGLLSAAPEVFCSLGLLVGYAVGAAVHWSHMALALGLLPNVVMTAGFFWLPESPGWLTAHYCFEEAAASYRFYRGEDFPAEREMQAAMQRAEKREDRGSVADVLRRMVRREALVPILLVTGLFVLQILSGMLAVLSYAVTIFQISGSSVDEYLCAVILGCTRLVCNVLASAFADRFGRKTLLIASSLVSALALVALGGFFFAQQRSLLPPGGALGWVPIVALILYMAAASFGIAPVTWMLLGELIPASVGMVANGAILTVWGLVYFAVLQAFPFLTQVLGAHGTFWGFAACCVALAVYTGLLVPETRGVELQDVAALFRRRPTPDKKADGTQDQRLRNLYGALPQPRNAIYLENQAVIQYVRRRAESCTGDLRTPAAN
ncbi:facilitated trehalose transporter Tret1-2 homolog [Pollicipes pollicipes]|uniref:facilitated trehalose transporter Tret1-2 homolog n=1 Tax=Pollicipes pollicipes TaxID=41117 RepID=UPI001884A018|nr:facilitated trehalose transporter Tret1-2 homolog [Pollicipes pollicipes]